MLAAVAMFGGCGDGGAAIAALNEVEALAATGHAGLDENALVVVWHVQDN